VLRLVLIAIAIGCALVACLQSQANPCEGGFVCPNGYICGASGTCVAADAPPQGAVCGNGVVEPPEECDEGDANSDASGASCLTNCRVPPRCGDRVISTGEQCDDGNLRSEDGCSSQCTAEVLTWTPHTSLEVTTGPGPLQNASVAIRRSGQVWIAGGGSGPARGSVWTWDPMYDGGDSGAFGSGEWRSIPSPSNDPQYLAYHEAENVQLLITVKGPEGKGAGDMEVWQLTPQSNSWTSVGEPYGAVLRLHAAGTRWDTGQAWVFVTWAEDASGNPDSDRLLMWDGGAWVQAGSWPAGLAGLPIGAGWSMHHNALVAVDEQGLAWNLDTGTQVGLEGLPGAPFLFGPAAVGDGVTMFVSEGEARGLYRLRDTWELIPMQGSPVPAHWFGFAMANVTPFVDTGNEPSIEQYVVFGGQVEDDRGVETLAQLWWSPDGASWRLGHDGALPGARRQAGLVWDRQRARLVMFGGRSGGVALSDMWEFAYGGWRLLPNEQTPPAVDRPVLGYDERTAAVIMVDGADGSSRDTWALWGSEWATIGVGNAPPAGVTSLVFDTHLDTVVAIGAGSPAHRWDGGGWSPVPLPGAGAGADLTGARAAHDAAHGVTVIHGQSTWVWSSEAETWTPIGIGPGPRVEPALVYHEHQQRALLYGGQGPDGEVRHDLWAFDAAALQWEELAQSPDSPSPMQGPMMAFDDVTRRVTVSGATMKEPGSGGVPPPPGLWTFQHEGLEPLDACDDADGDGDGLARCDDPDCSWRTACSPDLCEEDVGSCDYLPAPCVVCSAENECGYQAAPGFCLLPHGECLRKGQPYGACVCDPAEELARDCLWR